MEHLGVILMPNEMWLEKTNQSAAPYKTQDTVAVKKTPVGTT